MNPSQDFNRLYEDVSNSIASSVAEINELQVDHHEGKQELTNIAKRLAVIQQRFNGELHLLQKHAEWDKFTMAFFGETNAGKSTIIESLRILFREESRQELLQKNAHDLRAAEQDMTAHLQKVQNGMLAVYTEYTAEVAAINHSAMALAQVVRDESAARIKRKLWQFALAGMCAGALLASAIALLLKV